MTRGRVRSCLVRAGAALQLAAFTSVAATFVATLSRTLWRESRSGCARDGYVYCTAHAVDVGARWPAAVAGILMALLVVTTSGRLYRVAQALALVVVAAGTAVLTADQARLAGGSPAICRSAADGGCAFQTWHGRHLLVGAVVGIGLGLLTSGLEAASRRARAQGRLGVRRITGDLLVVLSVPVLLIGLLFLLDSRPDDRSGPVLWLMSAGGTFTLGQALVRGPWRPAVTGR
jgi:hypothetical protein